MGYTYIGIDPGITGAVAVIEIVEGAEQVELIDTPTMLTKIGKSNKQDYLPSQMAQILRNAIMRYQPAAFIEKVTAMPGQGVTSMFGFGKGFGMWVGILAALRIPYTMITPQAWKKALMRGMADKDASRMVAQQLFPQVSNMLSRKKDVGRADALLIAEYGRRESGSHGSK